MWCEARLSPTRVAERPRKRRKPGGRAGARQSGFESGSREIGKSRGSTKREREVGPSVCDETVFAGRPRVSSRRGTRHGERRERSRGGGSEGEPLLAPPNETGARRAAFEGKGGPSRDGGRSQEKTASRETRDGKRIELSLEGKDAKTFSLLINVAQPRSVVGVSFFLVPIHTPPVVPKIVPARRACNCVSDWLLPPLVAGELQNPSPATVGVHLQTMEAQKDRGGNFLFV